MRCVICCVLVIVTESRRSYRLRLRPELQAVDEAAIHEAIIDYGYNMRVLNSVLSKMVSTTADNVVCKAIRRLTLPIVQAIFSDPDSVPIDISNALVTTYRLGGSPLEDDPAYFKSDSTYQIISTAHLYRRIYVEFLRQSRITPLAMYDAFLPRYPRHSPTARQLFEIWAHDQITRGGNLKLRVMRDDKRRLWRDPTPLASTISLDLKPMPCRFVARGEVLTATAPYARKTYHITSASDNPSFSAFFLTDKHNVVVQTTLASRLDLSVDGFKLASEHFANLRKDLDTRPVKDIYVLVVPSRKDVVSAANPADEWLEKFTFCTLTLDTSNGVCHFPGLNDLLMCSNAMLQRSCSGTQRIMSLTILPKSVRRCETRRLFSKTRSMVGSPIIIHTYPR